MNIKIEIIYESISYQTYNDTACDTDISVSVNNNTSCIGDTPNNVCNNPAFDGCLSQNLVAFTCDLNPNPLSYRVVYLYVVVKPFFYGTY